MPGQVNGSSEPAEFWLFGYGSLIWKPPPHYDRRVPGYVTGYVRRFWQASEDHRGTPEAPGRVVTLIERDFWASLADAHDSAPDRVWGVAYRIKADKVAEVKDYLDIREINGYTIHYADFIPSHSSSSNSDSEITSPQSPIKTLVYIGTPSNPQFTGPQDPQALAEHIHGSHGPSGSNREYLLNLETALNALSPPDSGDAHIADLCDRVRILDKEVKVSEDGGCAGAEHGENMEPCAAKDGSSLHHHPHPHHSDRFQHPESVDEQEETEK